MSEGLEVGKDQIVDEFEHLNRGFEQPAPDRCYPGAAQTTGEDEWAESLRGTSNSSMKRSGLPNMCGCRSERPRLELYFTTIFDS
jgi:hypothetical protein